LKKADDKNDELQLKFTPAHRQYTHKTIKYSKITVENAGIKVKT